MPEDNTCAELLQRKAFFETSYDDINRTQTVGIFCMEQGSQPLTSRFIASPSNRHSIQGGVKVSASALVDGGETCRQHGGYYAALMPYDQTSPRQLRFKGMAMYSFSFLSLLSFIGIGLFSHSCRLNRRKDGLRNQVAEVHLVYFSLAS